MDAFRIGSDGDGTVAIVTGAGSGIGQASAIALARAGVQNLVLVGREAAKLAATAASINGLAGTKCRSVAVACDVATVRGREAIGAAAKKLGRVDCLVNNAGLFLGGAIEATTDADFEQQFAVNTTAPFALTRDLLPLLKLSANPSVINISSTLAAKPIANAAAYNASKAALEHLTRSMALELAPQRIRVNCIAPAIIATPMYRGRYANDADYVAGMEGAAKLHPLGRVGQPADVAHAVVFLASPAASWVTGIVLPVDGGMLVT